MDKFKFKNYEDLVSDVIRAMNEITEADELNDVAIIAKYEEARQIVKELLCAGLNINSISLDNEDMSGYCDEYIISIVDVGEGEGEGAEIWCEPFLREKGYIDDDSALTYILDNCSSKTIHHCKGKFVFEVSVGEEAEKEDCDCHKCKCCDNESSESESVYVSRKKDGTPTGFQKSWYTEDDGVNCYSSYAHYSSDVDMLRKIAKEFGVKL